MKSYYVVWTVALLLSLLPTASIADGTMVWENTLGGQDGLEWGYGLDASDDGTIFLTGVTYSSDGNITGYHGNGDLWVVQLNPDGTVISERAYGGNDTDYGLAIRSLPDGGSLVLGTAGSMNGDISLYQGMGDLWVIRLDAAGNIVWEQTYGGNLTDEGGDVVLTEDGGYFITGYSFSHENTDRQLGNGDLWLLRLDSSGKRLWEKYYGGSGRDSGNSIIQTSDGNYVIAGNTYSPDGDISKYQGSSDFWVIKVNSTGDLLWQKTYGGSGSDWAHSAAELPNGDLIIAGVTSSGDGDVSRKQGAGDIWVIRTASDGTLLWERTFGGSFSENIWSIKPSPDGGVFLAGESFSVDGDFSGAHGEGDLWVGELSGEGDLLWYKLLGGSLFEAGYGLDVTPDGSIVLTGTSFSSDGDVSTGNDIGDLWAVKLNITPSNESEIPNISQIEEEEKDDGEMEESESGLIIEALPGLSSPPTDPDNDGAYEDLNGNGKADLSDPTLLVTHLTWIKENYPSSFVDFNGNGIVDLADVQALFAEVSG